MILSAVELLHLPVASGESLGGYNPPFKLDPRGKAFWLKITWMGTYYFCHVQSIDCYFMGLGQYNPSYKALYAIINPE